VRVTKSTRRVRNLADEQLRKLVASLNFLHEGGLAIPLLIICGERAIRPLRDILLYGELMASPSHVRRWCGPLAELGARDVLLEYLAMEKDIADPVVRQAEDTVVNTAARALAAWCSEDVLVLFLHDRCPGRNRDVGKFSKA